MMKGIDISHWQDGINLTVVPCDFVIIKATQETRFVDSCFHKFYSTAKAAGKKLEFTTIIVLGNRKNRQSIFLKRCVRV